jgi:hypothetical protein
MSQVFTESAALQAAVDLAPGQGGYPLAMHTWQLTLEDKVGATRRVAPT